MRYQLFRVVILDPYNSVKPTLPHSFFVFYAHTDGEHLGKYDCIVWIQIFLGGVQVFYFRSLEGRHLSLIGFLIA